MNSLIMKILRTRSVAVTAAVLLSQTASADCEYPVRVDIPNGMTVDKATMLTAQKAVKDYVASMEAYLDCIVREEMEARRELDDLDAEVEQQREDLLNKKYNAAIGEMETLAARFNEEVQRFRERGL